MLAVQIGEHLSSGSKSDCARLKRSAPLGWGLDYGLVPSQASVARTPGSIGRSNALFTRWFDMHLSSSSAAGVRFLASVREGRGLKRSAREAGIGKETGYRWLREAYVAHRRGGKSIAETEAVMGFGLGEVDRLGSRGGCRPR